MLVQQQSLDIIQRLRINVGCRRVEDLCEVNDVTLKNLWVMADDIAVFLKRKDHLVIESPLHNVKHETDAYEKWRRVIYSKC